MKHHEMEKARETAEEQQEKTIGMKTGGNKDKYEEQ